MKYFCTEHKKPMKYQDCKGIKCSFAHPKGDYRGNTSRGFECSRFNPTEAEYSVLTELCNGLGTKDIASRLFVERATVRTHLNVLFHKMTVNSMHALVAKAYKNGWIKVSEEKKGGN